LPPTTQRLFPQRLRIEAVIVEINVGVSDSKINLYDLLTTDVAADRINDRRGKDFRIGPGGCTSWQSKDDKRRSVGPVVPGRDIKRVDVVCRRFHMTDEEEWGFRDYLHELKDSGNYGSKKNGDFTFKELVQLAREYLGLNDE
jgi:hypothetical protein